MFAVRAREDEAVPTGVDAQRRLRQIAVRGAEVASQISQLKAELVALTAETVAIGALSDMTPKAWVAWQFGLTPAEAGRVTWLARRLPNLPVLAQAFAD